MKKKATALLSLMLMLTVSVLFAGGGGQQQSGSTSGSGGVSGNLTFWYSNSEANQNDPGVIWWRDTLRLFQEKYPNVKLEISNTPDGNQYLTKLTTEIVAGNVPDVFWAWPSGRLEPFVNAKRIRPLNSFLDARPELKKTISPLATEGSTFNGNIYAIPIDQSGELVFYNKRIFRENNISVPKSYDEFMAACAALKAKNITPVVMGNLDVWPGAIPYMMLFNRMNGNKLYEDVIIGKQTKFDDPAFAETGKKLQEMVKAGVFNASANALKYDEAQVEYTTGRAAMVFDGIWALTGFLDKLGNDVGAFNFPMVPGGKGNANDYLINYGTVFCISQSTKNLPAAEALVEFILSPERQAAFVELGKVVASINLPVNYSNLPPILREINDDLAKANYAIIPYDNPLGSNMGTEFNLAVQRVLAGQDPVKVFQDLNKLARIEWE
ncbi:sugar ABC transporter substrate-binding protein [Spirochaetia bacterium]|nr:sugar ABC transporter substrate-binding protein [Spirochaetia bacterium]